MVQPSHKFVVVPRHELDFQLHMLPFFTVHLFEVIVHFFIFVELLTIFVSISFQPINQIKTNTSIHRPWTCGHTVAVLT